MAADACSSPPGRLFVMDRVSNLRLLVETGSDLCVFPRRLGPGHRERTSFDLFAANGTPIPTYGWHTLTLNLGLRRDFTWRFVVADVQIPITGVDLLANFSLLVDCRNNRILDRTTSLSAPAQTASTWFPSVKTIGSSTPTDDLFAGFSDLTRPSGVQRTVRHNTILHSTTPTHLQQEYPPHLSGQQATQGRLAHLQPRRTSAQRRTTSRPGHSLACSYTGPLHIFADRLPGHTDASSRPPTPHCS
jgi:hypothetical protein